MFRLKHTHYACLKIFTHLSSKLMVPMVFCTLSPLSRNLLVVGSNNWWLEGCGADVVGMGLGDPFRRAVSPNLLTPLATVTSWLKSVSGIGLPTLTPPTCICFALSTRNCKVWLLKYRFKGLFIVQLVPRLALRFWSKLNTKVAFNNHHPPTTTLN